MAPDRERSKSPMGRKPLPATVMHVKMCCSKCEEKAREECEEVEGVVKVVTEQGESKVIVYGPANSSALLKKMRRHLDKHATYWPTEDGQEVAPPLFPVDPRELQGRSREGGPKLHTGIPLAVDPSDGRPLVDSREVQQLERKMESAEIREKGDHPGENQGHRGQDQGPREVVFVPVDAKDGTPVDPRNVRAVDPRDGRPLPDAISRPLVDARELHQREREMKAGGDPRENQGQGPREVVLIPIDAKDGTPIDPRRVRMGDPCEGRPITPPHGRPIDPREGRPITPPHGRPIDTRELRPIDPRPGMPPELREVRPMIDPREMHEMRPVGPMDPREVQRMDPHMVRVVEPVVEHNGMRPVDPRMVRRMDPRGGARPVDPRDYGPPAYGPTSQPRGMSGVPEGLAPVRTAPRDAGDHYRVPVDPRGPPVSPTRGEYGPRSPRDSADYMGPRGPRGAVPEYYGPQSPREGDYGPRSPRGPDYGPRSPRELAGGPPRASGRPVLDRELSFSTDFRPSGDPRAMQGPPVDYRVPVEYRPVHSREVDSSAFEFRGHGGDSRDYAPPLPAARSPRAGNMGPSDPMGGEVRGYGDIDPRALRPSEPRILLDVTEDLRGADPRDRDYDPRDYRPGLEPPRRQHISQYSEFKRGEADLRDYQPKESYFSDYTPSQNYQPGPLSTQELDTLPVTNPNYMKRINMSES